jgi:6-phosphogluconolactonase
MSINNNYSANLIVADSVGTIPVHLNAAVVQYSQLAIQDHGSFTIALSGGSVPSFLSSLPDAFATAGIDNPSYDKWYILLADERCVNLDHEDSNLGSIRNKVLSKLSIPDNQVYSIDVSLLGAPTSAIAADYEIKLISVLQKSNNKLDLAILGFGPDGHTCSLFPDHELLFEQSLLVASLDDSPKPPPQRITLTFPVLNTMTHNIIFCGAGESKAPILKSVFTTIQKSNTCMENGAGEQYTVTYSNPPPFPCAMVQPTSNDSTVVWIVDTDAMKGITLPSTKL